MTKEKPNESQNPKKIEKVAIVGGGISGIGAAYSLRDSDLDVTVFEKEEELGGRVASRKYKGCIYDYGANYVNSRDEKVNQLIKEVWTGSDSDKNLLDVEEKVYAFDSRGNISEGKNSNHHKWSFKEGIQQLPKTLFDESQSTLITNVEIESIETGDKFVLTDSHGRSFGGFDTVVLTSPAPVTANIISDVYPETAGKIGSVDYRAVTSYALHYPFRIKRPFYGLVNTDKKHEVGWISREECKESHVPKKESVLIVQMSPEWSQESFGEEGEKIDEITTYVSKILDDRRLRKPDWWDFKPWETALPNRGVGTDVVRKHEDEGVFFAGDWVEGEGRVNKAMRTGIEAGKRVKAKLGN